MKTQKFSHGDLVQVATDLGPHMRHFDAGGRAIVEYSYRDQYGGDNTESYSIYIDGCGSVSWYSEHQLTLIEPGRADLLKAWRDAADEEASKKSDLDWIFANGEAVLKSPHSSSIQALANGLGMTNLWGSRGEGVVYLSNARAVMALAAPYLAAGDKPGWTALCASYISGASK